MTSERLVFLKKEIAGMTDEVKQDIEKKEQDKAKWEQTHAGVMSQ